MSFLSTQNDGLGEFILFILGISLLIYIIGACINYPKVEKKLINLNMKIKEKTFEWELKEEHLNHVIKQYQNKCDTLNNILSSKYPFYCVAELYSDVQLSVFDEAANYLENKSHPAHKSADEIKKELKSKSREYLVQYKEMSYKYQFLLNTFPELKQYIDDYEALKSLEFYNEYEEFKEYRDRVIDFLDKDEYSKLDEISRNQLALDRWEKKNKSNWTIGVQYEMYIDYLLRKEGVITDHFGRKGLNDLGRDIIGYYTNENGEEEIYIIQCKNWSANKEIHENVVCQLFGTAMEYEITQKDKRFTRVIPVLYTTTKLSDTAMKFAERLNVYVSIIPMGKYPMIKCNINSGNKIYHLPFDQQYYTTKISNEGEFYAWTVKEAEEKGFRRAHRYKGNKNN